MYSPCFRLHQNKAQHAELKIDPYEARQRLRAVKDAKAFPALAKSHQPKKAWEWEKSSPTLKETQGARV